MKTVNDFALQFATFSLQNISGVDNGLDIASFQYQFKPVKFVNLVVPSLCDTEPYNDLP